MNNTTNTTNTTKEVNLIAQLCFGWGWSQYLSSFLKLVKALENLGFKVNYTTEKVSGGKQDVYLVKGEEKILVFSRYQTGRVLEDNNSKEVAEKIKELLG